MTTAERSFEIKGIYHLYARGNHRERIFLSSDDYLHFVMKLYEYARLCEVTILAFCLMSNHYHLLVRQNSVINITSLMRRLNISYAKHFNWQYGQVGHVYQGRFGARHIESEADLANVARYIHRNPSTVIADVCSYQWSDLPLILIGRNTELLNLLEMTADQYKRFVSNEIKLALVQPTSEVSY